jgi:hypothetical protein
MTARPDHQVGDGDGAPSQERRQAIQMLSVVGAFALAWFVLSHWGIGDSTGDAVGEALGAALGLLILISIIGAVRGRGQ